MRLLSILIMLMVAGISQAKDKSAIQRFHSGDWEKDIGYTEITQKGKTLYISGVACGGENMKAAVIECYQTLGKILERFHTDASHVIKENVYTLDIDALKNVIPERKKFFKNDEYPAATWVQIQRLYMPEQIIEVEWIVEL